MKFSSSLTLLLLIIHCCSVNQTQGFNVGTAGAKVFTGTAEEEFGNTVKQFSNSKSKWLLVGSPWSGLTNMRQGDVYKCDVTSPNSTCQKMKLQMQNAANISLRLKLNQNTDCMTCAHTSWTQECEILNFVPEVCKEENSFFSSRKLPLPALQTCGGPVDLAIVVDGSNSIYPWEYVSRFLYKLLESLDIGPNKTQVSLMQYSVGQSFVFNLNTYQSKEEMLKIVNKTKQQHGIETLTFAAIDNARKLAFLPKRGGRSEATKVMLVVTDGESHDGRDSKIVIENCEKDKILRFGIAIQKQSADTEKFTEETELIASKPKKYFVFNVSNEAGLVNIAQSLAERIYSIQGYFLTGLKEQSSMYYVAGAPCSKHTGQVVVYTLNTQRQANIIHSEQGNQNGSYFGSVLCPLDVDRDGVTDLLLVGAPMYMSDQKKETGKVYIFSVSRGVLSKAGFLEGSSPLENAHFGMAIAAVPDLNLDGFSDVVVGAPLEDNNRGAIYIYNGDKKSIRKQSSQKILGSKLDPTLKFFGRSLDGSNDMNGDSLPDVSVGSYGKVLQLWSNGVVVVTEKITINPNNFSIQNQCKFNGRVMPCLTAKVCFTAAFRPANAKGSADIYPIKYTLTLDADMTSSRVTSRGQFSNSDRVTVQDINVSAQENCQGHPIYVHDFSDSVNPVALHVNINSQKEDSTPVLDQFSSQRWELKIPLLKDCGSDDECVSDLQISVKSADKGPSTLCLTLMLKNKKENAYNPTITANFSSNLVFSSVSHGIKHTSLTKSQIELHQVGNPVLETGQEVTFNITFYFYMKQAQETVELVFEAKSQSAEDHLPDNTVNYSTEIFLLSTFCIANP